MWACRASQPHLYEGAYSWTHRDRKRSLLRDFFNLFFDIAAVGGFSRQACTMDARRQRLPHWLGGPHRRIRQSSPTIQLTNPMTRGILTRLGHVPLWQEQAQWQPQVLLSICQGVGCPEQHGKAAPPSPQLPFSSCDLKTQTLLQKELSSVSGRHTSLVLSSLARVKQHFLLFFW